ncbi:MarR family transcriptional regulator [Lachnospiraceae bacterium 54-53]
MEKASIAMGLRSLNNMIRRYFQNSTSKREVDKLTDNNGWIIGFLADNEGKDVYQKDIEDYFTIARSTASTVLGLMEEKGFIRRLSVKSDGRLKKIVLTEKAWAVHKIMEKNKKEMERILLRGFTDEEVGALNEYLNRMKDNISGAQENQ